MTTFGVSNNYNMSKKIVDFKNRYSSLVKNSPMRIFWKQVKGPLVIKFTRKLCNYILKCVPRKLKNNETKHGMCYYIKFQITSDNKSKSVLIEVFIHVQWEEGLDNSDLNDSPQHSPIIMSVERMQ